MYIKRLHIKDLRIIQDMDISPISGINLITGDNGAGKTSVLEAIYLLGRGKSFRHRDAGPFIRTGCDHSLVTAELVKDDGNTTKLGVERTKNSIRVRQDGKDLLKRSSLLRALPLQIIAPNSHELIEKGPESRRSFMDYGMFHVEHGYLELIGEYSKGLKQRNAALRLKQLDVARSYNSFLSNLAEQIQGYRVTYVETLNSTLASTLEQLEVSFPVRLILKSGMNPNHSLEDQLVKKEALDSKRGYTSVGVHRADLQVYTEDVLAAHRLSRGQQKIIVYALKIAQSIIFRNITGVVPILMVDDLTAELDSEHLNRIMTLFQELRLQIFVTLLSLNRIDQDFFFKLFHVEHGAVDCPA